MCMVICSIVLGFLFGARNALWDYELYGIFKLHRYIIESLILTAIFL